MRKRTKRKRFSIANKYQRSILIPAIAANAILMLVVSLGVFYITIGAFTKGDSQFDFTVFNKAKVFSICFLAIVAYFNVVLFIWNHRVTHRLAGPLERIIRELDDIITGKKERRQIMLRKDDYLIELVNKINAILKQ